MRISDWSSDVCSSDLGVQAGAAEGLIDLVPALAENGEAPGAGAERRHGIPPQRHQGEEQQKPADNAAKDHPAPQLRIYFCHRPPARPEESRVGQEGVSKIRYL